MPILLRSQCRFCERFFRTALGCSRPLYARRDSSRSFALAIVQDAQPILRRPHVASYDAAALAHQYPQTHTEGVYFTKLLIILNFAWTGVRVFRIGKNMGRWCRQLLRRRALDLAMAIRPSPPLDSSADSVVGRTFASKCHSSASTGPRPARIFREGSRPLGIPTPAGPVRLPARATTAIATAASDIGE